MNSAWVPILLIGNGAAVALRHAKNASMEIPSDVLESAHLAVSKAKIELAIALFSAGLFRKAKRPN